MDCISSTKRLLLNTMSRKKLQNYWETKQWYMTSWIMDEKLLEIEDKICGMGKNFQINKSNFGKKKFHEVNTVLYTAIYRVLIRFTCRFVKMLAHLSTFSDMLTAINNPFLPPSRTIGSFPIQRRSKSKPLYNIE